MLRKAVSHECRQKPEATTERPGNDGRSPLASAWFLAGAVVLVCLACGKAVTGPGGGDAVDGEVRGGYGRHADVRTAPDFQPFPAEVGVSTDSGVEEVEEEPCQRVEGVAPFCLVEIGKAQGPVHSGLVLQPAQLEYVKESCDAYGPGMEELEVDFEEHFLIPLIYKDHCVTGLAQFSFLEVCTGPFAVIKPHAIAFCCGGREETTFSSVQYLLAPILALKAANVVSHVDVLQTTDFEKCIQENWLP